MSDTYINIQTANFRFSTLSDKSISTLLDTSNNAWTHYICIGILSRNVAFLLAMLFMTSAIVSEDLQLRELTSPFQSVENIVLKQNQHHPIHETHSLLTEHQIA
jgi:hypothetical protein